MVRDYSTRLITIRVVLRLRLTYRTDSSIISAMSVNRWLKILLLVVVGSFLLAFSNYPPGDELQRIRAFSRDREFDYVVVNDELGKAAEELKSVILGQRCRREIREKEIMPILKSFAEGD